MTARDALAQAWDALGGAAAPAEVIFEDAPVLPAALPVADLALATVAACALAAAEVSAARGRPVTAPLRVRADRVATSFTGDRRLRLRGAAFPSFAPLSAFFPAAEGFVRTHANYPHHRERLLAALGADVPAAIARRPAREVEEVVLAAGGLAFAVREPEEWAAHAQGQAVARLPLVARHSHPVVRPPREPVPSAGRPADGVRVLDLTRVIAGPVATRTLAFLGADVLRVDAPERPELEGQHQDTDIGKRSTLLDLRRSADRAAFEELVMGADVVVTGYRPGALDRFGLSPGDLLERRPDLVVARLSAWGADGPWAHRRGFDSLVQAATGIATVEGGPGRPGALPAQALDHGTGYLLAAAVLRALAAQQSEGGGHVAELALARTGRWLTELAPREQLAGVEPQPTLSDLGDVTCAAPAFALPGGPSTWDHPAGAWGGAPPTWR